MGFETGRDILNFIGNAITIGYWLFVVLIIGTILFSYKKAPIWGRIIVALIFGGLLMSWPIHNELKDKKELKRAIQAYDEFQKVCYEQSYDRIFKTAQKPKKLYLNTISDVKGAWDFWLFTGISYPKEWAGINIEPQSNKRHTKGSYEIRYEYQPNKQIIYDKELIFRGVKQQVINLYNNEVIAECKRKIFL